MKRDNIQWLVGCVLAGALSTTQFSTSAAEATEVELARSHVLAVDFTNMTFTVTLKETNLTVRCTPETRFFLYGMPAISKDMEVGDHVSGTLRRPPEGQVEAVFIHIDKLAPK
jgi:hypothetical protein